MSIEPEVTRIVQSWLDEGVTALPDHVLDAVLVQLPSTSQPRARRLRWRSNALVTPIRFAATAAAIGVLAIVAIAPIAPGPGATDLTAGTSQTAAPSRASVDLEPALVTGRLVWASGTRSDVWQEEVEVDGDWRQRVRERRARSVMSDPRLTGGVTVIDNADRFFARPGTDGFIGDVLWGSVVIENDLGSWTGTLVGTSDASAGGTGISYIELAGAGAYEGLVAILFERELTVWNWTWDGATFPGALPPDR